MTHFVNIACKSLITLYYHQITDSIFLATCFLFLFSLAQFVDNFGNVLSKIEINNINEAYTFNTIPELIEWQEVDIKNIESDIW